jgi:tetratricopeptide (TPR) repeat protein
MLVIGLVLLWSRFVGIYHYFLGSYLLEPSKINNNDSFCNIPDSIYSVEAKLNIIEAIQHLNIAQNKFPDNWYIQYQTGIAYCLIDDLTSAEIFLKQADKLSQNPLINLELGFLYARNHNAHSAINQWQEAGITFDDFLHLGDGFANIGDFHKAKNAYEHSIWLAPESSGAWKKIGQIFEKIGQINDAVDAYSKAIRLSPNDYDAYILLGKAYSIEDEWEKSQNVYSDLLTKFPDSIDAYLYLAETYEKLGKYDSAKNIYETAIKLGANLSGSTREIIHQKSWPHYKLGVIYHRNNDIRRAEQEYNLAIRLDPENYYTSWSNWGLGQIKLSDNQLEAAQLYFIRSLSATSYYYLRSQNFLGLAQISLMRDSIDQAIEYLRTAVQLDGDNQGLHLYYADTLYQAGRMDAAIAEYQAFLRKWPSAEDVALKLEGLIPEK